MEWSAASLNKNAVKKNITANTIDNDVVVQQEQLNKFQKN